MTSVPLLLIYTPSLLKRGGQGVSSSKITKIYSGINILPAFTNSSPSPFSLKEKAVKIGKILPYLKFLYIIT
jgi:hypothetical protein